MRVLIATDSVHTTAAACDYLEPRLNGDDTVAVVTVPADEARDAEDALNVATARLLGRADVRTARLDAADGDPTEAILAAPGLAAGLLSDRSYLGFPHVFCYALLNHGAVSSSSSHGERVAYGVVVLQTLLGEAAEAEPSELRAWYEELGADLSLRGLGADGDDDTLDAVAADVESKLDDAALTVPASRAEIARAIRRVERLDADTG